MLSSYQATIPDARRFEINLDQTIVTSQGLEVLRKHNIKGIQKHGKARFENNIKKNFDGEKFLRTFLLLSSYYSFAKEERDKSNLVYSETLLVMFLLCHLPCLFQA